MAIVFNCPQCDFPYKLKDELAGKKATCKNPDCRKQIVIPAVTGLRIADLGGIAPDDAGKDDTPLPTNPADIEAAALAALRETAQEQEDTAAEQAIPMVCPHCDHKWTEAYEKAGKNVLCPNEECRQRVKVTPPKKGDVPQDWRSGASNKPTLAKENFEKPTDVMDAEAKVVGKEAWQKGGGAEQELEPISLKRRLFVYSLIGAPILLLAAGIWGLYSWWGGRGEEISMDPAIKEFADNHEDLTPVQASLYSAILEIAAGEYDLHPKKMDKDKALALSLQHFTKAHSDLQQAAQKDAKGASAPERFAVASELAMATLGLGGNDEEVKEGARIRWVPNAPGNRPLRVNERIHTVHEQLSKMLGLMQDADFDTKSALARRLARELAKHGQFGLAIDFPGFLFREPELPEAKALVSLELYRANRNLEYPSKVADELKALLAGGATGRNPTPASAQTLWLILNTEKAPTLFGPPSAQISEPSRFAYVGLNLLKDQPSEALELCKRSGGSITGQLRALALYAEWAPDPGPAFDSAISAINLHGKSKSSEKPPPSLVLRLAQLAASTGRSDQAKQLADLVADEGLKVWAKGSAIQFAATPTNKIRVEDTELELPTDSKQLRAGHAWGKLWQARQNARYQSASEATKSIVAWPKGTIHPFGLAGIALAQHDK